jgi:phosphoglycolate phosphatase
VVKAVAFDLDGTLLIRCPTPTRRIALADKPRSRWASDRSPLHRNGIVADKRLLTERWRVSRRAAFARALELFESHYRTTLTRRTKAFPGVEDGLRRFQGEGLKLACITNKAESFTLPLLVASGLRQYFDLVLSGDSLPKRKPDPLPLLHCAEQFGALPGELLVVGDSVNDTEAARRAGCPVFCVPYGYGAGDVRDLDCDAIVGDLIEAFRLITALRL